MKINKEEESIQTEKQQLSRRDFLKATGVTAGIAGVATVGSATPVLAGEKDKGSAIMNFAVKEVDRPPYMDYPFEFDDSKFERFDRMHTAFNHPEFSKQFMDGKPWFVKYGELINKKVLENVPGWTLLDQALSSASATSDSGAAKEALMSWSPEGGIANIALAKEVGKIYTNPEDNNRYVKKAAHIFGAGDCGIAEVNEKWFYSGTGRYADDSSFRIIPWPIIFSDEHDVPTVTDEAKYIPKKMNRIIVLIIPMEGEIAKYSPSQLGNVTSALAYSHKIEMASKVAQFVRGLGYNAIPMGNDTAINIPCAIDAGLGELGRHGLLIHPKYGSMCKITKVLTDMPIAVDKPVNFGAAEFCRSCMKCAENCPSNSISKDKDPSYDVKCSSNNPGVKKWYINAWSCLDFWMNNNGGGCMNCQTVCPYSKPQTWIHDAVKGVSSRTSIFNSTFRFLDDALGYGKTIEENNPEDFWNQEGNGVEWLKI